MNGQPARMLPPCAAYNDAIRCRPMRTLTVALLILAVMAPAARADASARMKRPALPPLPGPAPAVIYAPCPGYDPAPRGCAIDPGDRDPSGRIWPNGAVFLRERSRYVQLHELGHIYGDIYLTRAEQVAFARAVDMPSRRWQITYWMDGMLVASPDSLSEIVADAYANCRMGHVRARHHAWSTDFDYYPTQAENLRGCQALARAR